MKMTRNWQLSALLLLVALVLTGCPKQTTVAEIKADPGQFEGKEVAIQGQVTNSFGVLGQGAYEVDDGTGQIWVISERHGVPGKDAQVRVKGKVISGFTFAGRSLGIVIRESDRDFKGSR